MIKIILVFAVFFAFDAVIFLGIKAGMKLKKRDRVYCKVIDIKNLGKDKKFIRNMNKF
jgi:hypothetical protein